MCSGRDHKAAVLEVHSLKGTDEAALGCSRNMYTQPYITPLRHCANIGDPPRGGDVGVASLRSIITKGCASWYPCDARPRISGMILLELPILGPVDLSSL